MSSLIYPWNGVEIQDPENKISKNKKKELKTIFRMRDINELNDSSQELLEKVAKITSQSSLKQEDIKMYREIDFKKSENEKANILIVSLLKWKKITSKKKILEKKLEDRINQKKEITEAAFESKLCIMSLSNTIGAYKVRLLNQHKYVAKLVVASLQNDDLSSFSKYIASFGTLHHLANTTATSNCQLFPYSYLPGDSMF